MNGNQQSALAALRSVEPIVTRLDRSREPEDRAADILELWQGTETALRALMGGSSLGGQALIRRAEGFEHHWPRQLSGGMQQRTALARALANEPKILLLDEPFGALDHQTRELMQELLLEIWEADRKTVLFVTHDIDEAVFLANRVLVMSARPGRIKAEVVVPLSYPREWTVKTTPEFGALKARLMAEIREEVRKAAIG